MINRIIEENNIENPDLIHRGDNLILPDLFENEESVNNNKNNVNIDSFEKWNSTENAEKFILGEEIEDFKMFDYENGNSEEYISKLTEFSQEYINKYDADGDKSLNKEEFIELGMGDVKFDKDYVESLGYVYSEENAATLYENQKAILSLIYNGFKMNDIDGIQADEFASQFMITDYYDNSEFKTDGKINFAIYNSFATNPIEYDENGNVVYSQSYQNEIEERKGLWNIIFNN